jgi:hypothetical protein
MIESLLKILHKLAIVAAFLAVHVLIVGLLIAAVWASERLFHLFYDGEGAVLFSFLPVRYIFDFLDFAIVCIFGYFVIREAVNVFRSE